MEFDLLVSVVQPGDIIALPRPLRHARRYILVISKDRCGRGFYYCPCDFDGFPQKEYGDRIRATNYINHSNMILVGDEKDACEIRNSRGLESRTVFYNCKRYTWHLTGDGAIDSCMSNLDARWELFYDAADSEKSDQYARREDQNSHSENAEFVNHFAFGMLLDKCLKAKQMKRRQRAGA